MQQIRSDQIRFPCERHCTVRFEIELFLIEMSRPGAEERYLGVTPWLGALGLKSHPYTPYLEAPAVVSSLWLSERNPPSQLAN